MNRNDSDTADYFEACHKSLAIILPDAVSDAISAYKNLTEEFEKDCSAKDHQLHHAACKAALQHIELLMKLASSLNARKSTVEDNDIAELMAKADLELNTYKANVSDS